ncbi:ABC transporter substrate-binding protein [Emergencia sp. JLR.KK010]|jgi:peptide/nickel transport system substrate-binding protein|uniref:ABC transporter substrate-binding protein n=1 Tax=Emergencia sp. JLR.KK010 TaxID=3114296 RepID=UPI00203C6ECC
MKKRILISFLCCLLAVTMLTGCGGDDSQGSGKNPEEITISYEYKSPLNPFDYSTDLTRNIVDNLIRVDRDNGDSITGILAESYEVSDDQLEWTFHLRDAKFSDGKQVTADDVVGSLEYALSTPTGAVNYVGYSAEAKDEKTVVIKLATMSPNAAYYISTIPVINMEKFKELGDEKYFAEMIGSGAYMLESYDEATGLAILVENPEYWGEAPSIKKVTMRYIPDSNTALIALRNGEVDFTDIPSSTCKQASGDDNLKVEFGRQTLGNYIIFNTEADQVKDEKLRQAILYAIDCDGLAKMSAVEGDYAVENCFYLDTWGIDKEGIPTYGYDPEKAKALIKEAGLSTPVDLGEIKITGDQASMWEAIQQSLAEVGINIKVSSVETTVWLESIWKGDFKMGAMTNSEMISFGDVCENFHSEGIELGYNLCRYNDATLDKYIDAARFSTDSETQMKNFKEVAKIINEKALWADLFHYGRIYAMNKNLNAKVEDPNIYFNEMSWN